MPFVHPFKMKKKKNKTTKTKPQKPDKQRFSRKIIISTTQIRLTRSKLAHVSK